MVDIKIGQQHISLMCGYKPPSVNNNTFSDEMYSLLDAAIFNRSNLICLGDLNCDILHPLEDGKEGRAWLDICDIYDLQNLICEPTRISKTRVMLRSDSHKRSSICTALRDTRGRLERSQVGLHGSQ